MPLLPAHTLKVEEHLKTSKFMSGFAPPSDVEADPDELHVVNRALSNRPPVMARRDSAVSPSSVCAQGSRSRPGPARRPTGGTSPAAAQTSARFKGVGERETRVRRT